MSLDKEKVRQTLSQLSWAKGLTKEEMMLSLGKPEEKLNEELYYHLAPNKKFRDPEEVIDSLPNSVWTGVGDKLHEARPVLGPKVAPESAARGETTLKPQKERTRERHLNGDDD